MASTAGDEVSAGAVLRLINNRARALRKKQKRIIQMEESLARGEVLNSDQQEVLHSNPAISALIDELEKLRQPLYDAVAQEISLAVQVSAAPTTTAKPEDETPPNVEQQSGESAASEHDQAAVDELEKLRQPLSVSVPQEISLAVQVSAAPTTTTKPEDETTTTKPEDETPPNVEQQSGESPAPEHDQAAVEELLNLLYFGSLFDLKTQSEDTLINSTRSHERGCCLTHADPDMLAEKDLDSLSSLSCLLITRPVDSRLSHKNALQRCIEHANRWLTNSDQPIEPNGSVTYASLRERLSKVMALDYFTITPEMKAAEEMAAVAGGNFAPFQVGGVDVDSSFVQLQQQKNKGKEKVVELDMKVEKKDGSQAHVADDKNYMQRQKQLLNDTKEKIKARLNKSTLIGANITRYEFLCDEPSQTSFNGKIFFEYGEEREVRFLKSGEEEAKKIFSATYDLHNEAILKVWFATYCDAIGSWILCYDRFDYLLGDWVENPDIQRKMRHDDLLLPYGSNLILPLLKAIIYLHEHGLFHEGLDQTENYVVVSGKVKMINIGMHSLKDFPAPGDDATANTLRMNDFMALKDLLKMHVLQPGVDWSERDLFLSFFDLIALVGYNKFIDKLKAHSFFMATADERMKSFFDIVHARDTKMLPRLEEFCDMLEDEAAFEGRYLGWDTKMGPNLRKIFEYKNDKGKSRRYNGQLAMHLLELIRNAYRHPRQSTMECLDKEVRKEYSDFLHRLHEVVCRLERPTLEDEVPSTKKERKEM